MNGEIAENYLSENFPLYGIVTTVLILQESSRSHAVFTVIVEHATDDGCGGSVVTVGKLRLIDLAGSER